MADKNKKSGERIDTTVSKKVKARQRLQTFLYLCIIFGSIALIVVFANFVIEPAVLYQSAGKQAKQGNYQQALEMYSKLDGFMKSEEKIEEMQKALLDQAFNIGNYEAAVIAAENSGELQTYIEEKPELFYHYAASMLEKNPTIAKIYIAYVLDYPGAKEMYDEACLRSAIQLIESGSYADVILNFDEASSMDWFLSLAPSTVYNMALDVAHYSYVRAGIMLDLIKDVNPAAAEKREELNTYLEYCGEKTCISDTSEESTVGATNVFDFFSLDEKEYLIVTNGDVSMVYDAHNSAFEKDPSDGSYFASSTDDATNTQYSYRFYMLENGVLEEKLTITLDDGSQSEISRLWS